MLLPKRSSHCLSRLSCPFLNVICPPYPDARTRFTAYCVRPKSLFTISLMVNTMQMKTKKYPSGISTEQFEQIRPLLERSAQKDRAAHGRPARSVQRGVVSSQEQVLVAHAARRISEMAHGAFVFCQVKRTRPGRYQRFGTGIKNQVDTARTGQGCSVMTCFLIVDAQR